MGEMMVSITMTINLGYQDKFNNIVCQIEGTNEANQSERRIKPKANDEQTKAKPMANYKYQCPYVIQTICGSLSMSRLSLCECN